MIKFAHLFFRGLNFGGIDSQVFLPMTTAFVPFCWVVSLAKCLISCGRRHGRRPSWPIPKDSPQPATIRWIFMVNFISSRYLFSLEKYLLWPLAFVSVSNVRLSNEHWSDTALELPGRTTNYDVTALPFRAIKFEMWNHHQSFYV